MIKWILSYLASFWHYALFQQQDENKMVLLETIKKQNVIVKHILKAQHLNKSSEYIQKP